MHESLLYIGYYINQKTFDKIVSERINDMSAARQSLEESLLKEMACINGVKVQALSYVPSSAAIDVPEFSIINGLQIHHIPIEKNNMFSCIKAAWNFWRYLQAQVPKGTSVLMYAVNPVFMIPLSIAKQTKQLTLTTICSEVPAFRRYDQSLPMRIKQFIQTFFNNRFDRYVLLTERMKDVVNVGHKPYMVMEGIASNLPEKPYIGIRRNIVMYAGGLHYDNNLLMLIEACERSKDVEECWICGSGPQEDEIRRLAIKYSKIKYLGRKNHDQVLTLERQAKILVNLRDPSNILTDYSFPSKLIEYLASGAQVVSTNLRGIPQEYFDYVHSFKGQDIEELISIFDNIISETDEYLQERAKAALEFLRKEKSAEKQTSKIAKFICH